MGVVAEESQMSSTCRNVTPPFVLESKLVKLTAKFPLMDVWVATDGAFRRQEPGMVLLSMIVA
jgi:hypothetical protein